MKIYTAHLHPDRTPVLVPEGFSWGALFFGPLWLAWHAAWIAAALAFAAFVFACKLPPPAWRPLAAFGVLLLGVLGQDIRRRSLAWGRYRLDHVVAAGSRDEAMLRLLTVRPDLRRLV